MPQGFTRVARVAMLAQFGVLAFAFQSAGPIEVIPKAAPKAAAPVVRVDSSLVLIPVHVTTSGGAFVTGLKKEDFELFEDGVRQTITHFSQDDAPVSAGVLLDVSGSVAGIIGTEKAAAARFFDEVLRPGDQALLVGFASLIAVWQELTPSKERLQRALERAGPLDLPAGSPEARPRGATLLYDTITLVAAQRLRSLPGRKTIILITGGQDNGSIADIAKAVQAALGADAVVYGIHYQDQHFPYSGGNGMSALERLSEPTGGRTFRVSGKMPLGMVFDEIGEGMRNQYGLGFRPPADGKEGQFHKLEVKSTMAGVKVQARSGYYSRRR